MLISKGQGGPSLIGLLLVTVILSIYSLDPTNANPLTKKEMGKVRKLLWNSVQEKYSTEEKDKFADLLIQATDDVKNWTFYHSGNEQQPVFISLGKGRVGKGVHVLQRGEDYVDPRDKQNFVVLFQQPSKQDRYSVHIAHILDIQNIDTSAVMWNDGRVEQQKDMTKVLELVGNKEVQMRALRSQRPRCDWIGYILLCDAPENVKPIRERQVQEPLDKEDTPPVNPNVDLDSLSEREGPNSTAKDDGEDKSKRNTVVQWKQENRADSSLAEQKDQQEVSLVRVPNLGPVIRVDGVKTEDKFVLYAPRETVALASAPSPSKDIAPLMVKVVELEGASPLEDASADAKAASPLEDASADAKAASRDEITTASQNAPTTEVNASDGTTQNPESSTKRPRRKHRKHGKNHKSKSKQKKEASQ